MTVVTRFAPSPTGFLHLGSARTGLFNYLFAKHHNGKYLLRIEDTDRERSTDEAIDAIIAGMEWLGIEHDEDITYQFKQTDRHAEIANQLLQEGKAYKCYCSKEELEAMREEAKAKKLPYKYNGKWRDKDESEAPNGIDPVIRLKAPQEGETIIEDLIQGTVTVANTQLDDMILLRSDGTPTYMLAVVVDDHDMGITHVIRGDDHLTNATRQTILYQALGWDIPQFAHIPLIHGHDGAKLSKRHGALGIEAYRDMGILPEAMCNYLLRLGWSHGDDEIIPKDKAIEWFSLDNVGKSPSRFDTQKLEHINGVYLNDVNNEYLLDLVMQYLANEHNIDISHEAKDKMFALLDLFKERAKTINEIGEAMLFIIHGTPKNYTEKAETILSDSKELHLEVINLAKELDITNWNRDNLHDLFKQRCQDKDIKLGKLMGMVRAIITGSHASPSMFDILAVLGKDDTIKRLEYTLTDKRGPTPNEV